uniref:Uncharacterized protein n=1 Tax=viral metagenome TaxID=1070528 RepID=A0A6M3JKI1_9ZZZZ
MKPKTKEITRDKLQLAFNAWLQDYQSDAWTDLTSEERLVLSEYHFDKFVKEIENI